MGGYQAATLIIKMDSFEKTDDRSTVVGLGVILHEADNPMMYRKMLQPVVTHYRQRNLLRLETLVKLPQLLVEAFKRPRFQLTLSNGEVLSIELDGGITEGQRIREALKRLK